MSDDLWPEKLDFPKMDSPLSILKQQTSFPSRLTSGIVTSRVRSETIEPGRLAYDTQSSMTVPQDISGADLSALRGTQTGITMTTWFRSALLLKVVALGNFEKPIVTIYQCLPPYPVVVVDPFSEKRGETNVYIAATETAYKKRLKEIFTSQALKDLMAALVTHVTGR